MGKKQRRNFLMNPYGEASIRYAGLRMDNNNDEKEPEVVQRTPDNRFLVTANPKGTISVFPLVDIPSYRVEIETHQTTVTHLVVEGKITQILPNYEVGPEGVIMKMMLNPASDYLRDLPAVPTFTLTLHDQVDARRFDFRNGNDNDDHWVAIVTLTTKSPEQRYTKFDRVFRVGYNGHYATELLSQFARSEARTFGRGFTPPQNEKRDESDDETIATNSDADQEDQLSYEEQKEAKMVKIVENRKTLRKATPIDNWIQIGPTHRVDTEKNTITVDELKRAISKATDAEAVRNTARLYVEVKPEKKNTKPIDMPKLVKIKQTRNSEVTPPNRPNQSEPPVFTAKPLTIPPTECVARPSRKSSVGEQPRHTSRESSLSYRSEEATDKSLGETSNASMVPKSVEKKKNKKSKKDIWDVVKTLTAALNEVIERTRDSSEEDE